MSTKHTPRLLAELVKSREEAAARYGAGMAEWERGQISGQEMGQLKRRLKRAEIAVQVARSQS